MAYDTEYTREPVCPHCGQRILDACEIDSCDERFTEIECYGCEKPIDVMRNISISYTTRPNESARAAVEREAIKEDGET